MYVSSGPPTVYGQDRAAPGGSAGCVQGLGERSGHSRSHVEREGSKRTFLVAA